MLIMYWLLQMNAQKNTPKLAGQFERNERLSKDLTLQFAEAGVFHMLVPKEYGGLEVHPREFVQVLKNLSIGDGSAGLYAMIGSTTGVLSACLEDEFAREIYGNKPGVLTVGVSALVGRAERVESGYRVSGRWPFASGSQNADWIGGGTSIYETSVLPLCFRDIHVNTQHIMVAAPVYEVAGIIELGIDPRQPI